MFNKNFGNSRVTGLKEISLPEPVSMVPETIGWLILTLVVIAWLVYFGIRLYRQWQRNRYRHKALLELATIEGQWAQGESIGLVLPFDRPRVRPPGSQGEPPQCRMVAGDPVRRPRPGRRRRPRFL